LASAPFVGLASSQLPPIYPARNEGDDCIVEINWFGDMLKWFGPLKRDDSILGTIKTMLRYP